ncbi:MAG: DUF533 domain-containing protein [Pseudomonadota bacterium]
MPLDKILHSVKDNPAITGALSGAAGGALVSAFTGKKSAKKLLKGAGLVAIGGLAWQAYQNYKKDDSAGDNPALPDKLDRNRLEAIVDTTPAQAESTALVMQAMIAAAHADEHLTTAEQQQIWKAALEHGVPAQELSTLQEQLSAPMPIEYFAAAAGDMETRMDVYTAALVVIDEECAAGQQFLGELGRQLALPSGLVAALHTQYANA